MSVMSACWSVSEVRVNVSYGRKAGPGPMGGRECAQRCQDCSVLMCEIYNINVRKVGSGPGWGLFLAIPVSLLGID